MAIDRDLFFARRLGLGLRLGEALPASPREWAMDQLRQVPPVDFFGSDGKSIADQLPTGTKFIDNFLAACKEWEVFKTKENELQATGQKLSASEYERRGYLEVYRPYYATPRWRDCLVKTLTAVNGVAPVFERFWMFWSNHFTVSTDVVKHVALLRGPHTIGIRNRLTGTFAELLFHAIANPAMLIYLNNNTSHGPNSQVARLGKERQEVNENLARELLELHTMSPSGGYTQKDVTETALILTGWTMYAGPVSNDGYTEKSPYGTFFASFGHEPGARSVLGKSYLQKGTGENQLDELIHDLAYHPATASHIAFKLARHFVADDPSKESVDRIAKAFVDTGGNLISIHSAVVDEVLKISFESSKVMTPENWLFQSYRLTGAPVPLSMPFEDKEAVLDVLREMGQSFDECPQPNGYSDLRADWLSKEMLDRRVRQAYRIGQSAHGLNSEALGDYAARLAGGDSTLVPLVRRAESVPEAVALLLAAPKFLKM